jgi:MFS family permease
VHESPRPQKSWPYLTQLSYNYLGWAFCWTTATAYMVPNMLLRLVDDSVKNARLGLMTSLGNVLVIVSIPLIGTLSDRTRSRFGRRRPFYLPAAIAMSIFVLAVVWSRHYLFLLALLVLMHGSLALWFPNRALIRDIVPLERRGRISGLGNIMNTLGIMLAHIVASTFIERGRMLALALVAGSATVIANLWVAFRIKEFVPDGKPARATLSWREAYLPKLDGTSGLGWLAAVNFFTYMGVVAMTCFLLYFIKDQIDPVHFNATFGKTVLIAMGTAIPSSLGAGFVADRFGRKRVFVLACLLQILAMLNFLLSPRVHSTLYLSGFLYGLGNGAYMSLYWTMLSDMVPEDEASKHIGLMQYTMQIPWAVIPITLGPIVDSFGTTSGVGYNILFSSIVIFFVIGVLMIRKVPETLNSESASVVQDG